MTLNEMTKRLAKEYFNSLSTSSLLQLLKHTAFLYYSFSVSFQTSYSLKLEEAANGKQQRQSHSNYLVHLYTTAIFLPV